MENLGEGVCAMDWVGIFGVGEGVVIAGGLDDFKVYTKCSPPVPAQNPKLLLSQCVLSPRTQPSAILYRS